MKFLVAAFLITAAIVPAAGEECIASWYCAGFQGRQTASGEAYNCDAMTVAHKTEKFGTMLTVLNKNNGKSVVLRVNDRGPFVKGRCVDVSRAAKNALGMDGLAPVAVSK